VLNFIRPGRPVENAYIESFNGRVRDERLNEHGFLIIVHARGIIARWRIEYNTERPYSSIGNLKPEEYARTCFPSELRPRFGRETALPGKTLTESREKADF
jgi:Integrase core domain